jgi:hypothetical protein
MCAFHRRIGRTLRLSGFSKEILPDPNDGSLWAYNNILGNDGNQGRHDLVSDARVDVTYGLYGAARKPGGCGLKFALVVFPAGIGAPPAPNVLTVPSIGPLFDNFIRHSEVLISGCVDDMPSPVFLSRVAHVLSPSEHLVMYMWLDNGAVPDRIQMVAISGISFSVRIK